MHRSDLLARLEYIILRCLEKEPELRIQSVAELSRDLAPFGTGPWRRTRSIPSSR